MKKKTSPYLVESKYDFRDWKSNELGLLPSEEDNINPYMLALIVSAVFLSAIMFPVTTISIIFFMFAITA